MGSRRREFPRAMTWLVGLTIAVMVTTAAHIGSPDAWVEGKAGPYPVVVNVQVPGVVPGIAQVYVQITGEGVQEVSAVGNKFDATGAAPPPEVADAVAGSPGLYHVSLWMMTPGSSSVTVFVRGARGEGKILVPVVIAAHQRLAFSRPLAIGLGAIGILLFLGAVSIVGAAAREAVSMPGVKPNAERKQRARIAMGVAVVVFGILLMGGWHWWNIEDAKFVKSLYKPMASTARVREHNGTRYVDVIITDSLWTRRHDTTWMTRRNTSILSPLVPDHGKLMHLFLIREPNHDVLAHLHPTTTDSVTFSVVPPPLPAGRYRVLADIVRESGYEETMTSIVDVPAVADSSRGVDPDDSWFVGSASSADTMVLSDGSVMRWNRGTTQLVANRPAPLSFTVTDAAGKPVVLEPYMGMAAHAMILRDDETVFTHIHPTGTVSMAAQEAFLVRQSTDTLPGMVAQRMQHDAMAMTMPMPSTVVGNTVRFPYAFPKEGNYRVWVQVKRAGRVLTGTFRAQVAQGTRP